MQTEDPTDDQEPLGHAMQAAIDMLPMFGFAVPARHIVQELAPARDQVAAGQGRQLF